MIEEAAVDDLWRSLNAGDKVRIVSWPPELFEERLHQSTKDLYHWLIDSRSVLVITRIDEDGLPWGEIQRVLDGIHVYESLALNHGGLGIVERRGADPT